MLLTTMVVMLASANLAPPCAEPVYEAVLLAIREERSPRPLVVGTTRILKEYDEPPSPENSDLGHLDPSWLARLQAQGVISDSSSAPEATRVTISFSRVLWEGESSARVEVGLYERADDGSAAFKSFMLYSLQRSPSGIWTVSGKEPRTSLYLIPDA
ncbi:MAG: hypothetical protein M3418_12555 [Gemmatimonadota bacterium]|nr:hypothetical protein [Gemmatimonadota bacterium]